MCSSLYETRIKTGHDTNTGIQEKTWRHHIHAERKNNEMSNKTKC